MSKACMECGRQFIKPYKYSKAQWAAKRFCSNRCSTDYRFRVGKLRPFQKGHRHKESTKKKLSNAKLGSKNPNWRGGTIKGDRYYMKTLVAPKTYKKTHRYIVEQHLGRELKSDEHVHHINGNKTDNRIENLIVLTKSFHHSLHGKMRVKK